MYLFSNSMPMQVSFTHIHSFLVKELALVWHQKGITHKFAHWKGKEKKLTLKKYYFYFQYLILLNLQLLLIAFVNEWQVCREWNSFQMVLQIMTNFQLAIAKELQPLISNVFVYEHLSIIKLAGPIADMCGAT